MRAFERHVLKHVRQARDAGDLLSSSDVGSRIERKDGSLRSFHDHHGQAIGQLFDGDPLLKRFNVLGEKSGGEEEETKKGSELARKEDLHKSFPLKGKGYGASLSNQMRGLVANRAALQQQFAENIAVIVGKFMDKKR